jgi:hypothetical protein
MDKYIIINYYSDSNFNRKKELIYCIQKNLNLSFIKRVIIFLENQSHEEDLKALKNYKKILFININKRLDFRTAINFADKYLKKSVIIILNLDIFLANSSQWKNIHKFFNTGYKDKAIVCTRTSILINKLHKQIIFQEHDSIKMGDFSDGWVLRTPFNKEFVKSNLSFSVGNSPGCDGLMMGILNRFYHVYNYQDKYRIYHLDLVKKNKLTNSSENFLYKTKYSIINSSADLRPLKRADEWCEIPLDQDWEFLHKHKKKPICHFSFKKNFFSKFRGIYYYLVFFLLKFKSKF